MDTHFHFHAYHAIVMMVRPCGENDQRNHRNDNGSYGKSVHHAHVNVVLQRYSFCSTLTTVYPPFCRCGANAGQLLSDTLQKERLQILTMREQIRTMRLPIKKGAARMNHNGNFLNFAAYNHNFLTTMIKDIILKSTGAMLLLFTCSAAFAQTRGFWQTRLDQWKFSKDRKNWECVQLFPRKGLLQTHIGLDSDRPTEAILPVVRRSGTGSRGQCQRQAASTPHGRLYAFCHRTERTSESR